MKFPISISKHFISITWFWELLGVIVKKKDEQYVPLTALQLENCWDVDRKYSIDAQRIVEMEGNEFRAEEEQGDEETDCKR